MRRKMFKWRIIKGTVVAGIKYRKCGGHSSGHYVGARVCTEQNNETTANDTISKG